MLVELSKLIPEVEKVRKENRVHLLRGTNNDLVSKKRPAESKTVNEWRIANYRVLNHEIFETYLRLLKELFIDEALQLESGNEEIKSFIANNKLLNFYCDDVLFTSLLDANAITVIIPKNRPEDQSKVIELDYYNVLTENIFYENGKFYIRSKEKVKIGEVTDFTYFSFDLNAIYFHYKDRSGNLIQEDYYTHNLGFLPIVNMPSELAVSLTGKKYRESSVKTTTGYLDEFVNVFSDTQWLMTKNSHATFVTPPIACSECKGEINIIKDGKSIQCPSCNGTGKQRSPGISEYIVLPTVSYDDKVDTRVPFYLSPDVGSLNFAWEKCFSLLDKAAATLGINPLINSTESGEAMKMRMKKWETTANYQYFKMIEYFETFLEIVSGYLVINENARTKIKINTIDNVMNKDVIYLRSMAESALSFERTQAYIQYIDRKYRNDEALKKVYKLIALNYPILTYNLDELKNYIAFSLITEEEIKEAKEFEKRILKRVADDPKSITEASEVDLLKI